MIYYLMLRNNFGIYTSSQKPRLSKNIKASIIYNTYYEREFKKEN